MFYKNQLTKIRNNKTDFLMNWSAKTEAFWWG